MSRRSRGSFLLNSSHAVGDEHTEACSKELRRHYDSTIVYTGIYEDEEVIHASAMGVSGILVYRPVVNMGTGDRVKGPVQLFVSSLLHEFCSGKIFLIKLLLPHHPSAREKLGPRYDQVSASSYAKTTEFLLWTLKNVNMEDSGGRTPLKRLLLWLAADKTCATSWIPVLEFLLNSGAQLSKSKRETSAMTLLYFLAENNFSRKTCGDGCEKELLRSLAQQTDKEAVDPDSLKDIFQNKNQFLAEILGTLK